VSADGSLQLLRKANERLRVERSARCFNGMTIGDRPMTDADLDARGVTDFERLQTRVSQRSISAAVVEQNETAIQNGGLGRKLVGLGLRRLFNAGQPVDVWQEVFHEQGREWIYRENTGEWELLTTSRNAKARPGHWDSNDRAAAVEILDVVTEVTDVKAGEAIGGTPTTRVTARADLNLIWDRLSWSTQNAMSTMGTDDWTAAVPVIVWLDESGLPHRLSHAKLPGAPHEETIWATLELHDFGATVVNPLPVT
jgi:hypothetical protein